MTEYRIRALKCHPDKRPDDEECLVQFQRLQEAKEVLCDPTKRKDYDRWRSGGLSMSWKQWNAFRNSANLVRFLPCVLSS
jgi:DnaJ homolog subfamily C member 12